MSVDYRYDLEEERIVSEIKKNNAKMVLLHLPDGLKAKADLIQRNIEVNCEGVDVIIWAGSNFGACDLPVDANRLGVDLVLHFGHSPWLS
ncbi:MAG: diphthamide synthesis protein [Candidatus Woesearchaeota archaeon]